MRDVIADIDRWLESGTQQIALATVVDTWGSAPRKVGAKMAFTADNRISGSVSGGCVEGAVIEAGHDVLTTGQPQLLHFGVADETAWDVGLACGGSIAVFVEALDHRTYAFIRDRVLAGATAVVATVIDGQRDLVGKKVVAGQGEVSVVQLPESVVLATRRLIDQAAEPGRYLLTGLADVEGDLNIFVDVLHPPPALVIIGGAHIAVALTRLAKIVGYQTVVVDPRRAFGSTERFPEVDRLLQDWPDRALAQVALTPQTAVVTLSHDPKIDDPALQVALASEAFYVGALGSPQTHAARSQRLREKGVGPTQLDRIHAPVGLDIGADNPEEIALAILAEVINAYHRRHEGASGDAG